MSHQESVEPTSEGSSLTDGSSQLEDVSPAVFESGLPAELTAMRAMFDAGDFTNAHELAQNCLMRAIEGHDRDAQGWALVYLAMCDWRSSRIRRANDACQKAALLFRGTRNVLGETRALIILTYTSSTLGRHEEAVEAGLLASRLTALETAKHLRAPAFHYLGRAYSMCQRLDKADEAFKESFASAAQTYPAHSSAFQTHLAMINGELVRLIHERTSTGALPPLLRLAELSDRARAHLDAMGDSPLLDGMSASIASRLDSYLAIRAIWDGEIELATAFLQQAQVAVLRHEGAAWLHLMISWVQVEMHLAHGESGKAIDVAAGALNLAAIVEHESFVSTLNTVLVHAHQLRGDHASAMAQHHVIRRREAAIRGEALASRERIIQWQMESRDRDETLTALESEARRLAKLSIEDPLTGLVNRRGFEERLAQELTTADQQSGTLCVSFIDVDRFKAINDGFSHATGDRVLIELGRILSAEVRDGDYVARLAGDEFVILFSRTDELVAAKVCARIAKAVSQHDWLAIASNLHVSVTIGVAQSRPGDSAAELLNRSDTSMYERKRAIGAAALRVAAT